MTKTDPSLLVARSQPRGPHGRSLHSVLKSFCSVRVSMKVTRCGSVWTTLRCWKPSSANSHLHVVAVDPDVKKIDQLRRQLDEVGLYGTARDASPRRPGRRSTPRPIWPI